MPRSPKTEWLTVVLADDRMKYHTKAIAAVMYQAADADGKNSKVSADEIGARLGMPAGKSRRGTVGDELKPLKTLGYLHTAARHVPGKAGTNFTLVLPPVHAGSTPHKGDAMQGVHAGSTPHKGDAMQGVMQGAMQGDSPHNHYTNHSINHVTSNTVTAAEGSGKDVRSAEDVEREALAFLAELEGGTVEPPNDGSVEPPNGGTVEPTTTLQSPPRASAERERGSTEPKPFVPPPNVKINPPNKFGNRPTDPARFIAPNPRDFSDEKRGVLLREFYRLHPKAQQWPGVRDCILSMGLNPNVTMLELRPDEREKQKARPGYFSLFRNAEPKSTWGDAAAPGELPFRYHQEMQTGASVGIDQGDRFTAGNSEYDPSMDW